ncbi:MAG: DUF4105 domain-containing protein [Halioglobus sp.]
MVKRWYKKPWLYALLPIALLAIVVLLHSPSNEGPWKPEQRRTAFARQEGRSLIVHNIRDFRYDRRGAAIRSQEYLDKRYDLDELQGIWFGLSHFGPYGLAHSFLSFEFGPGQYLVLSVEARQRPGQHYQPVMGLLRKYTKIYVASTEQDVIGVRSQLRGERVLLYPVVKDGNSTAEELLLALIDDMNALHEQPEFYNTLLDNCLTNLLKHSTSFEDISAVDLRVLLPGHTDRLTYALGTTPNTMSFDTARNMATVDPSLTAIDDDDFSDRIRCGWHGYGKLQFPACR